MINEIRPIENQNTLSIGLFLVILHADKIPPHIGILYDGKFYSQKVSGKDFGVKLEHLSKLLLTKSIPTLFYKLKNIPAGKVEAIFEKIPAEIKDNETCLNPINEVLVSDEKFYIVSELINYLTINEEISELYGLNLPENFVAIPEYTKEQVDKRIAYLKNDKRR